MGLQLQFVGKIFGRERRVHRANIVRLVEVRVAVRAVDTAERQHIGDSLDTKQLLRCKDTRKRRVRVGTVEISPVVEAPQHTGGIALTGLLLNTQPVVILPKIERHQIERGTRGRLEAQRTTHRVHIAPVDIVAVVEVGRISVAIEIKACRAKG